MSKKKKNKIVPRSDANQGQKERAARIKKETEYKLKKYQEYIQKLKEEENKRKLQNLDSTTITTPTSGDSEDTSTKTI